VQYVVLSDKWHQYDGIMHKRPDDFKLKGWWKKHVTGSYYKKCLEHRLAAVELMLPDVTSYVRTDLEYSTTKEFIETVDQIYFCVNHRFNEELTEAADMIELTKACNTYIICHWNLFYSFLNKYNVYCLIYFSFIYAVTRFIIIITLHSIIYYFLCGLR